MSFNLSHYYYVQNGKSNPQKREEVEWTNNIDEETKSVVENILDFDFFPKEENKINHINYKDYFEIPVEGRESFTLTITYPGLLIGAGYSHDSLKKVDNEKDDIGDFQLGFFFDHTTGLPAIPGSSVKGILKDVFPKIKDNETKKQAKIEYILEKLKKTEAKIEESFLRKNWEEIFFERKQVFFDAYVRKVENNFTKADNSKIAKLLGDDYITPHTEGIFKNPIPIRFLKVMPGVDFTFLFKLIDYKDEKGEIKAAAIRDVFKQILLDFGIGAKRNVGYGNFIDSQAQT